jgi:hypothetical protein
MIEEDQERWKCHTTSKQKTPMGQASWPDKVHWGSFTNLVGNPSVGRNADSSGSTAPKYPSIVYNIILSHRTINHGR